MGRINDRCFLFLQVDVYAGAIFIQQAIGWNTYLSIAILLVVTGIYTVIGKLYVYAGAIII